MQIHRRKSLRAIGSASEVRMQFYAISAERELQHPAAVAIRNAAKQELFN